MWEFFANSLWSFIGSLIGLLGIGLALLFYLRGNKTKKMSYQVRRYTIFGERIASLDGLDISYQGIKLTKLFDYRILVWNSGNEVLHPSDFPSSRQLRILISQGSENVIAANLLGASAEPNEPKLEFINPVDK